jgi:hypothetical protein
VSRLAQRVRPPSVPTGPGPGDAPDLRTGPVDPSAAGFALASLRIDRAARPDRRRRRVNSRANLWGVDLRGAADILLAFAVVLLLLAAIAAAVGLVSFAR